MRIAFVAETPGCPVYLGGGHRHTQASRMLVPSTYESFSSMLTASISLGRPVVASRVGATTDITEQGKNAVLVTASADDELAEAATDLRLSSDKTRELGSQARHTVETRFAPLAAARTRADLHDRVCGEAPGNL